MNKKIIPAGLIIFVISSLFSCGTTGSKDEADIWQTAGWVDDNTYRIRASGAPEIVTGTAEKKKDSARNKAVLSAHYELVEKLYGDGVDPCGGMSPCREIREKFRRELVAIVKKGRIVAERFSDDLSCEIMYEVKSPKLRERVELIRSY